MRIKDYWAEGYIISALFLPLGIFSLENTVSLAIKHKTVVTSHTWDKLLTKADRRRCCSTGVFFFLSFGYIEKALWTLCTRGLNTGF